MTRLGTKASFDQTTAAMLKSFHDKWYAPNNAILVVAGDLDPAATLAKIRKLFGGIPAKTLPARAPLHFVAGQAPVIHAEQRPAVRHGSDRDTHAGHGQPGLPCA